MKWKIPLYKVHADEEDIRAVTRVIRRGMDWAIGPEIEQFEKMLADYVGVDYCLAFNSGTSAGHAALLALGIQSGDEIIVPSFTFIATVNWVLMVNAKPKFADIEEITLGLDPSKIGRQISRRTKAIIPVHYAGSPCLINDINTVSKDHKIALIEDAAESLGSKMGKKNIGTFGDISVFSFAGNKVLTTGEGGAITTNSRKLFEKMKLIRSHGRLINQNYFSTNEIPRYVELGYNWRMSSITAALGISQLNRFEKLVNLRRKHARYISARLSKFKEITVPNEPNGFRHTYQLYTIRLENSKMRNELQKFLTKRGIMSKIFFEPVHLTEFYKNTKFSESADLSVTENTYERILTLPMYPGLTRENLDFICNAVEEFIESTK